MKKVVVVAILAFTIGCGDDDDSSNNAGNNTATNNATNNAATNNAATNNAATNNATNNAATNNAATNNATNNSVEPAFSQTVDGFTLEMNPAAEVLKVGANTFAFTLKDSSGPVDATSFEVTGWMPAHGHGTAVPTTVENTGTGTYDAVVTFNMGGDWDLQIAADDRDFTFSVQVVQ